MQNNFKCILFFTSMDNELDKVLAWIDERDAHAEQWLNDRAAERFNLPRESDMAAYVQFILTDELLAD